MWWFGDILIIYNNGLTSIIKTLLLATFEDTYGVKILKTSEDRYDDIKTLNKDI